jgi:hypothetical protein
MRYRKQFHDTDTTEKPDVQIWIDQTAIPVKDDSEWTLGTGMAASSGSLVLTASPDGEVASRNIPGVLEGHLYMFTVVVDSIDAGKLDVTLGGAVVGSLDSAGTLVLDVRPSAGNTLAITVDNDASTVTATISSLTVEAMDPVSLELIPQI